MDEAVAILGCGPAGLFAAQAVRLRGWTPIIMSKKVKSHIYGAQYLHKPIPGLSNSKPDGDITTHRLGTAARYAERVYGDVSMVTSWDKVREGPVPAWDLRKTYEAAWNQFEPMIIEQDIKPSDIGELTATFEVVISTIPLWSICEDTEHHEFKSVPIYVKQEMAYTGLPVLWTPYHGGVVYNGTNYGGWYRTSHIFGHSSTEAHPKDMLRDYTPRLGGAQSWTQGFKVAGNNCDCHPNLFRAGRMGLWERGILTHHAFESAITAMGERLVS